MSTLFDTLPNRRAIIDRRIVADRIAAIAEQEGQNAQLLRAAIVNELRSALEEGRGEAARRLAMHPTRGR